MVLFMVQKCTSKCMRNFSTNVIQATTLQAVELKIQYNVSQEDGAPSQAVLKNLVGLHTVLLCYLLPVCNSTVLAVPVGPNYLCQVMI